MSSDEGREGDTAEVRMSAALGSGICHLGDVENDITDLVMPAGALAGGTTKGMGAIDVESAVTEAPNRNRAAAI